MPLLGEFSEPPLLGRLAWVVSMEGGRVLCRVSRFPATDVVAVEVVLAVLECAGCFACTLAVRPTGLDAGVVLVDVLLCSPLLDADARVVEVLSGLAEILLLVICPFNSGMASSCFIRTERGLAPDVEIEGGRTDVGLASLELWPAVDRRGIFELSSSAARAFSRAATFTVSSLSSPLSPLSNTFLPLALVLEVWETRLRLFNLVSLSVS